MKRLLLTIPLLIAIPAKGQAAGDGAAPVQRGIADQAQAAPLTQDELVARLDDADFATRALAEQHLLARTELSSEALRQYLLQSTSEEQRHRLMRLARHHVLREIREQQFGPDAKPGQDGAVIAPDLHEAAAIGFSYEPTANNNDAALTPAGIAVVSTMPGFPGHAYLRRGDIITAVDGQTAKHIQHQFMATSWVAQRIAAHRPGQTIEITVFRDGRSVTLAFACAQASALKAMYSTNGAAIAVLNPPYTERWQQARNKLAADLPQPKRLTPAE